MSNIKDQAPCPVAMKVDGNEMQMPVGELNKCSIIYAGKSYGACRQMDTSGVEVKSLQ